MSRSYENCHITTKKLLNDLDEILKDKGYNSRSKGIQDAVEEHVLRYKNE